MGRKRTYKRRFWIVWLIMPVDPPKINVYDQDHSKYPPKELYYDKISIQEYKEYLFKKMFKELDDTEKVKKYVRRDRFDLLDFS